MPLRFARLDRVRSHRISVTIEDSENLLRNFFVLAGSATRNDDGDNSFNAAESVRGPDRRRRPNGAGMDGTDKIFRKERHLRSMFHTLTSPSTGLRGIVSSIQNLAAHLRALELGISAHIFLTDASRFLTGSPWRRDTFFAKNETALSTGRYLLRCQSTCPWTKNRDRDHINE